MLQEASSEGQPWPLVLPVAVWSGGRVSLPWMGRDWKLGELKVPGQARRAQVPSIWPPGTPPFGLIPPEGPAGQSSGLSFPKSGEWRRRLGYNCAYLLTSIPRGVAEAGTW